MPRQRLILAALLVALSLGTPSAPTLAQTAPPLSYLNPKLPVETRVGDLLGRMTLPEKVGQMLQVNVTRLMGSDAWDRGPLNPEQLQEVLQGAHVGSVLSGGGAAPIPNTPRAWAELTNALQKFTLEQSRLRVPLLYGADGVHGHNNVIGATLYPHNLGLAASFDPVLAGKVAAQTGAAMRATGVRWNFAPDADLGRDPRWGRFYETFGEEPALAGAFVAAQVRGFQTGDLKAGVAATVKHFIGYGQAESGRDRAGAELPDGALRGLLLPPFEAAIQAGAASVMVNSGAVDGVPAHASKPLLTDLLRDQLRFGGVTISDWDDVAKLKTVHKVAGTDAEAVRLAVNAGVDVMMVPSEAASTAAQLVQLVKDGQVPQARIDEAAGRILTLKFRLGLFEKPYVDPAAAERTVGSGRDLAHEAAAASLTLLKNDHALLPIRPNVRLVLVVGPAANDLAGQLGGWSVEWQGLPPNTQVPGTTVLQGLKAAAPKGLQVAYQGGLQLPDLQAAARSADLIVSVLAEKPYAEGQGDNPNLALPDDQLQVAHNVAALKKPVVTVLFAGRPVGLDEVLPASGALLMAYLPGTEGGRAVADALYGRRAPSGRLPFSWPAAATQLPSTLQTPSAQAPLFPFGAGLTYTSFAASGLKVNGSVATLALRNTGARPGRRTMLAFATPAGGGRRLVAWSQDLLRPGEAHTLRLTLPELPAGTVLTVEGQSATLP